MDMKIARGLLLCVPCISLTIATASATGVWPDKRVNLVVPFPAGGGTDLMARVIADKLQSKLGQPVVIVNRAGASGIIGTTSVANAASDGYTYVLGVAGTHAINATFFTKLSYDPIRDFEPVALVATAPHLVLVNSESPIKTLADLVQHAKQSNPSLSYGSYGLGSTSYFISEYFGKKNDVKLLHVPYKGVPPAINALIGKQISMAIVPSGAALPQIAAGRIRPLAVTTAQRIPQLPDVPTLTELGYDNAVFTNWYGIFAPAKTSSGIISKFATEIKAVMSDADVRKSLATQGADASFMGPETFKPFVSSEKERWRKLVELSDVRGD